MKKVNVLLQIYINFQTTIQNNTYHLNQLLLLKKIKVNDFHKELH